MANDVPAPCDSGRFQALVSSAARPMLTPTPSSSQALGSGAVTCSITEGIATISFYHPKSNSLPAALLADIAGRITSVGKHPATRVVVIRSEGGGPFCAGASFDELKRIDSPEAGKEFFMGFARVIARDASLPEAHRHARAGQGRRRRCGNHRRVRLRAGGAGGAGAPQ